MNVPICSFGLQSRPPARSGLWPEKGQLIGPETGFRTKPVRLEIGGNQLFSTFGVLARFLLSKLSLFLCQTMVRAGRIQDMLKRYFSLSTPEPQIH